VVPEEALVPVGGRQYLYRIVEGANGQKVAQRLEARMGLRLPGKVEILQGLQGGDLVATAGQARLTRGDNLPVRVIELGGAAAASAAPAGPAAPSNGPSAGSAAGSARRPERTVTAPHSPPEVKPR
jgi:membrane fusion protein (multidrug efflux system)